MDIGTRSRPARRTVQAHPGGSPVGAWLDYFAANPARQAAIEAGVDWAAPHALPHATAAALVACLQRFELGESGDGAHLVGLARRAGDHSYTAAVQLLVTEEQHHSALFGRALTHLGGRSLDSHWSDRMFTLLRRSMGLRTELALFLVAETVALDVFLALEACTADPVLAAVGHGVVTDEHEHIRFQIDRLHAGTADLGRAQRRALAVAWTIVAVGAATVLAAGHAPAIRALGRSPLLLWARGLQRFHASARLALGGPRDRFLGPSPLATRY